MNHYFKVFCGYAAIVLEWFLLFWDALWSVVGIIMAFLCITTTIYTVTNEDAKVILLFTICCVYVAGIVHAVLAGVEAFLFNCTYIGYVNRVVNQDTIPKKARYLSFGFILFVILGLLSSTVGTDVMGDTGQTFTGDPFWRNVTDTMLQACVMTVLGKGVHEKVLGNAWKRISGT